MLKMDIPKTFKPEQNLEANTQRLLEEEIKLSKPESKIEKTELEEVLREFDYDSENLHSKIDKLIEKSGYKPIKNEKLYYEYWYKSKPFDENYVFIRRVNKQSRNYAFARVESDKLTEFCRRFGKKESGTKKYMALLFPLGFSLGFIVPYLSSYSDPVPLWKTSLFLGGIFGLFAQLCMVPLSDYIRLRNKKKMEQYCEGLITESKGAIKAAFS